MRRPGDKSTDPRRERERERKRSPLLSICAYDNFLMRPALIRYADSRTAVGFTLPLSRRSPGQVSRQQLLHRGRCLTGHSIFERVVVTFAPNRITPAPAFISPLTSARCCPIVSNTRGIPLRLAASYETRTGNATEPGRRKTPNKVRTLQYLRVVGVADARVECNTTAPVSACIFIRK